MLEMHLNIYVLRDIDEALAEKTKRLMERRTLLLYSDERLGHPKRWSTSYWSKFQARAHMHTPPVIDKDRKCSTPIKDWISSGDILLE